MNKFLVLLSFYSISLSAMSFELPSKEKDISDAERVYYNEIEKKYKTYFTHNLCTEYAEKNPHEQNKTPIIQRFDKVVEYRALQLHTLQHNPRLKPAFCKLFNNPKTRLNAYDLLHIDRKIADEALRSVLADRRLITFIIKGNFDQPWLVRPEFDQIWSAIRSEISPKKAFVQEVRTFAQAEKVGDASVSSAIRRGGRQRLEFVFG